MCRGLFHAPSRLAHFHLAHIANVRVPTLVELDDMQIAAGEIRISFRPPPMFKNKCVAFGPVADLAGITAV